MAFQVALKPPGLGRGGCCRHRAQARRAWEPGAAAERQQMALAGAFRGGSSQISSQDGSRPLCLPLPLPPTPPGGVWGWSRAAPEPWGMAACWAPSPNHKGTARGCELLDLEQDPGLRGGFYSLPPRCEAPASAGWRGGELNRGVCTQKLSEPSPKRQGTEQKKPKKTTKLGGTAQSSRGLTWVTMASRPLCPHA